MTPTKEREENNMRTVTYTVQTPENVIETTSYAKATEAGNRIIETRLVRKPDPEDEKAVRELIEFRRKYKRA